MGQQDSLDLITLASKACLLGEAHVSDELIGPRLLAHHRVAELGHERALPAFLPSKTIRTAENRPASRCGEGHRRGPRARARSASEDPLGVDSFATHHLPLDEAPHAYEIFQKKKEGAFEILLKP